MPERWNVFPMFANVIFMYLQIKSSSVTPIATFSGHSMGSVGHGQEQLGRDMAPWMMAWQGQGDFREMQGGSSIIVTWVGDGGAPGGGQKQEGPEVPHGRDMHRQQ